MTNKLSFLAKNAYKILFFNILIVGIFVSCQQRSNTNPSDVPANPYPEHAGKFFYRLRLSMAKFNTLKGYFPDTAHDNHLVFQFFYTGDTVLSSPTLFAYSRRPTSLGDTTHYPPEILDFDSVTAEPLTGRAQVLGDLQIRIDSLMDLVRQTGSDTGSYQYFLFTPVFHPDNPHEAYNVSLVGSSSLAGTKHADPSPPAKGY